MMLLLARNGVNSGMKEVIGCKGCSDKNSGGFFVKTIAKP
jgi:hypothetical protein